MLFGRAQKHPITIPAKPVAEWVYTTCGYCSTGCSLEVGLDRNGRAISARGVADADVNRGKLCLKGIYEYELFNSSGRGTRPLVRERYFEPYRAAGWDQALDRTAAEIERIQCAHGRDAFAIVSTGQIYTEEFYTLGKLARGVIEDLPEGRSQAKLAIPGFPDTSISRPNIRFQQVRALPADFTRPDGVPIHYQRDAAHAHRTKARPADGARAWGLGMLCSRENPLVAFTLLSQFAIGSYLMLFLLPLLAPAAAQAFQQHPGLLTGSLFGLLGAQAFGLFLSASHLGKPQRFYRGFNNLRHSWLSREALALFFAALGVHAFIDTFPALTSWLPAPLAQIAGWSAAVLGPGALYCMYRIYRVKARPFWDHWHSGAAFLASSLILGSLGAGLVFGLARLAAGESPADLLRLLSAPLLAGWLLQAGALFAHLRYLARRGAEAEVSRMQMLTVYGKTYGARWASLAALAAGSALLGLWAPAGAWGLIAWGVLSLLAVAHETVGRMLFYVLVTPTTLPGAFFWNNRYFETHARRTGLARLPQVGVAADAH